MSIQLLAEAQAAAFQALTDICADPAGYDVETQQLRANVAFSVVQMVPPGAFDYTGPDFTPELEEAPEQVDGEVIDFPTQELTEAEALAALEQVTVVHQPGPDPHRAPPLGGAS